MRPRALRIATVMIACTYVACTTRDRVTGPESAVGSPREFAAAVEQQGCGVSCALTVSNAPLWSALAIADSLAIPVELATMTLAGAAGDSVTIGLTADSALLDAIPAVEMLSVLTSSATTQIPLGDIGTARVVYRFSSADTVLVRYHLNRRFASVPEGAFVLKQETSARVVAATTPWVPPGSGGASLRAATAASVVDPCTGPIPVPVSGTYCGVAVQISPYAAASAFLAAGAQFQSKPGTGVSLPITITFSTAVSEVTVKAYDPTFAGNRMEAFDANSVSLGVFPFPGNNRPGTLTIQPGTLTGAISRVVLIPAPLDFVNYSMTVTFVASAELALACPGTAVRVTVVSCVVTATDGNPFRVDSMIAFPTGGPPVQLPNHPATFASGGADTARGELIVETRLRIWGQATGQSAAMEKQALMTPTPRVWAGLVTYPDSVPEVKKATDFAQGVHEQYWVPLPNGKDDHPQGYAGVYAVSMGGSFSIAQGINGMWAYSKDPIAFTKPIVWISAGLSAGSPYYDAQDIVQKPGQPANTPYSRWCTRQDVDEYRLRVLEHEGAESGQVQSHHRQYISYFATHDPSTIGERAAFILPDVPGPGQVKELRDNALDAAGLAAAVADNNSVVHATANLTPPPNCKLRMPP